MATLSLIAEPFPDWEAPVHLAAARDLTEALAETAPRSCSARFLIARGTDAAPFSSPKIAVEQLPMRAGSLPFLWQTNATARPLDGEMTHAMTPLIPLRSRSEDDGTQSTVNVPHCLAWEQPELLTSSQVRLMRSFVRRAARHADILTTGSHATAKHLQQHYGHDLPVQVIPPAAPSPFLALPDVVDRRTRLGLPETYIVTTAHDDAFGRLQWIFDALGSDPSLPHLIVLSGLDPTTQEKNAPAAEELAGRVPEQLRERVTVLRVDSLQDLGDVGAVLSGARLLVQPQSFATTGYAVIAALMSQVPVLHAGTDVVTEHTVDAGLAEPEQLGFVTALSRLFFPSTGDGTSELERLTVFAADRGRTFSWQSVAWQLWETHASI